MRLQGKLRRELRERKKAKNEIIFNKNEIIFNKNEIIFNKVHFQLDSVFICSHRCEQAGLERQPR